MFGFTWMHNELKRAWLANWPKLGLNLIQPTPND